MTDKRLFMVLAHVPGKFYAAMGLLLLSNCFIAAAPAAAGDGKIIAVYGDAVGRTNFPPGWSFQWNAGGKMGDSTGYASLVCVESSAGKRKSVTYGVPDAAGGLLPDRPSHGYVGDVFSARDKDGTARYAIASYTLQDDPQGEIWINNGNMRSRSFDETLLEIYLNDELKFSSPVKKDRVPLLFQKKMGRLKKGDSVRVAVGPGEKAAKGGGRLRYTIEEFPQGQKPGEPVNILLPALTAAEPQRGADGRYEKYAAQHKAQCDAILSNKAELVFIGDSHTARLSADLLKERYGQYRPVNLGIGGDWIQNVLWRVLNGVFGQIPVKVIVVEIGANNLVNDFTTEEVVEGIERLIKTLHEKAPGSKILLLGIFPRGVSIREPINDKMRQANAKLALLADNKDVFFLDVGDKLVEPDGALGHAFMPWPDRHLSGPGNVRWLDAMRPTLDKLLDNP